MSTRSFGRKAGTAVGQRGFGSATWTGNVALKTYKTVTGGNHAAGHAGLVVLALLLSSAAQAGVIKSVVNKSGPGYLSATILPILTSLPNNDNVTDPSANVVVINKAAKAFDYIDIVFQVQNGAGTTEYYMVDSPVNLSGIPWPSWEFQLGFGTGASFVPSTLADNLDFDAFPGPLPLPTSGDYNWLLWSPDVLQWRSGVVNPGFSTSFTFSVDVPNFNANIPLSAKTTTPVDGYTFTLRQLPVAVPEPSSLALLVFGGIGVALRRRRQVA